MKEKLIRSYVYALFCLTTIMTTELMGNTSMNLNDEKPFLGRWDIDVISSGPGYINRARFCWLELKLENGMLQGRLQPGEGATVNVTEIKIENGELSFRPVNQTLVKWKAIKKGRHLEGTVNSPIFGKETRSWIGVRAPVWPSSPPIRKPDKPVDLIGEDVSDWFVQTPDIPIGWSVKDGILMNQSKQANNIYSKQKFQDFKLDAEFKVDPKSNSGIYLRGRYEIQVMDGYDETSLNIHSQGCLYGYIVPSVNACRPAGEWQTFEITLIANHVTIILNGVKIIENGEVPGITGGALDAKEKDPGPIMIQGDHGTVQWRKLIITPLI
ncbi:MAG TPA: DUF1080 domain-containing protein [Bacteroidales bacterium]|nr:DUF1080 domain-containing protein [Bacteroidales bacterium]